VVRLRNCSQPTVVSGKKQMAHITIGGDALAGEAWLVLGPSEHKLSPEDIKVNEGLVKGLIMVQYDDKKKTVVVVLNPLARGTKVKEAALELLGSSCERIYKAAASKVRLNAKAGTSETLNLTAADARFIMRGAGKALGITPTFDF
jgi:hypothetical protein